jgi:hypothetical protein
MTEPLVTGKTKRELAPLRAAFWPNVITGPRDTCWHWRKSVGSSDYGALPWKGKRIAAHRVSLALALGHDIPDGAFVCHHCDTPACVNPAHLYVGDAKTNATDAKLRKGQSPHRYRVTLLGTSPDGERGAASGTVTVLDKSEHQRLRERLAARLTKRGYTLGHSERIVPLKRKPKKTLAL